MPCARTLKTVYLHDLSQGSFNSFVQGLGNGQFPSLTKLEFKDMGDMRMDRVGKLVDAFVNLMDAGTPCPLKELYISGSNRNLVFHMDVFTPLFEKDALPSLTSLEFSWEGRATAGAGFPAAWTALGPKVKLQRLAIDIRMDENVATRFLKALANPAFCPSVSVFRVFPRELNGRAVDRKRAKKALDTRWWKREGRSEAPPRTTESRVQELQMRVKELEAKEQRRWQRKEEQRRQEEERRRSRIPAMMS